VVAGDATLITAVVARNAWTLTHAPWRPVRSRALCAGALDARVRRVDDHARGARDPRLARDRQPVATYNLAVFAAFLLAATAMYLLVADWTGSRAAGVIAGFSYAFASERIAGITHLFVFDTTWVVLALFFARRWLAFGRWR
jgi:hypothetical protein